MAIAEPPNLRPHFDEAGEKTVTRERVSVGPEDIAIVAK